MKLSSFKLAWYTMNIWNTEFPIDMGWLMICSTWPGWPGWPGPPPAIDWLQGAVAPQRPRAAGRVSSWVLGTELKGPQGVPSKK